MDFRKLRVEGMLLRKYLGLYFRTEGLGGLITWQKLKRGRSGNGRSLQPKKIES